MPCTAKVCSEFHSLPTLTPPHTHRLTPPTVAATVSSTLGCALLQWAGVHPSTDPYGATSHPVLHFPSKVRSQQQGEDACIRGAQRRSFSPVECRVPPLFRLKAGGLKTRAEPRGLPARKVFTARTTPQPPHALYEIKETIPLSVRQVSFINFS